MGFVSADWQMGSQGCAELYYAFFFLKFQLFKGVSLGKSWWSRKGPSFCGVLVDFTLQLGAAWTLLQWEVTSFPFSLEEPSSVEPLVTFS